MPVVRRPGGGRPRLYCSDAHRAEARRRRLGAGLPQPPGNHAAGEGTGLSGTRVLLVEALARLERAEAEAPGNDALVAAIRAEATEEVLRAQRAAAEAARRAASAHERLERERAQWREDLEHLAAERAEHARTVEELTGALDGARAELEAELLRHHADAARAESLLEACRVAHDAEVAQAAVAAGELQRLVAAAEGAAEQVRQRAERAERRLDEYRAGTVELEVRAARAEERSRRDADRLAEVRAELDKARKELTGERRRLRSVEAELRRGVAARAGGGAGPTVAGRGSRARRAQAPASGATR